MNSNVRSAIDAYKCRIPTDDELTDLLDMINSSGMKLAEQESACSYLQSVLDEAPANIKLEEERQKKRNQQRLYKMYEEQERRKQMSDRISNWGMYSGFALMIVIPLLGTICGMSFWPQMILDIIIVVSVMMGSFLYSIYYRDGHL